MKMLGGTVVLSISEFNRLNEERKILREAVVAFGSHDVECPCYKSSTNDKHSYTCTCGFGEFTDLSPIQAVFPTLEEPPLDYSLSAESQSKTVHLDLKASVGLNSCFSSAFIDGPKIRTVVGLNADKVPGADCRTIPSVVGRALEECVELCIAAGMKTGEIYSHVTDSLYNQYVKHSKVSGKLVYPSTPVAPNPALYLKNIAEEAADVIVRLMDVAHVANVDVPAAYERKELEFIAKVYSGAFYADKRGNLYVHKPHLDVKKEDSNG